MTWNIAPECVSLIFISIIWVYSRKGNPLPSLKNRFFQLCFLVTFSSMLFNIFSTLLIGTLNAWTLPLAWIVTILYYITTPAMGLVYCLYVMSYVFEDPKRMRHAGYWATLPIVLYAVMVLCTPFTAHLFHLSLSEGYVRGPFRMITYILFYLYCALCVLFALGFGKKLPRTIRRILLSFPLIAALVIVAQQQFSTVMLSGSAATSALLILYLFLQNKQLSIDPLTGLPNRQELLKMLNLKFEHRERFVLLIFSLKEFKFVNDTHGQQNGDALLVAFSAWIQESFSPAEWQLYRYSGDEFALLLENEQQADWEDLRKKTERRLSFPWLLDDCSCFLDCGIGVIQCPDCTDHLDSLLHGIEYAVTKAKRESSQGRLCVCTRVLLEQAKRRQGILDLLHSYLDTDRFELYYQPIFSPLDGCFVSAEALLRMNNTPLGNLSPNEFIPIAEESGLIVDITYQVLDAVCLTLHTLLENGITIDGINVNLSALQFSQVDLLSRIEALVHLHDIPFPSLRLEITESTLAENPKTLSDFILHANALGMRVSLDDFGTGYSNLSSVIQLAIDTVKLDKSLVYASMENERSSILVRSLVRAFRELGSTVLAEGVETEAQRCFVCDCGCSLIQGFLYAKPMPKQEFIRFLQEHSAQSVPTPH